MILEKLAARRRVEPNGFRWRAGDVTRLEQFSDAVFGFALALLVVSADVPTSVADLFATLRDFPAFGATFATLIWIWYYHNLYFRRFGFVDAFTTFLNAVLLFLILFFVFPLKFMFSSILGGFMGRGWNFTFQEGQVLMAVYSLGFVAVFAMFALMYRHALRFKDDLELNQIEMAITRGSLKANLLLCGVGVVAALLNWLGPSWITPFTGVFYGSIGPLMWWHWTRVDKTVKAITPLPAPRDS